MSLNPVQFTRDVIDLFGRYLLTTFPVADERLAAQIRDRMRHTVVGDSLLYKGPYVYLNRPFKPGPAVQELVDAGSLHPVIRSHRVFPYDELHFHQAQTLDAVQAGQHVVLSTGTGSGKTEAFLLPILDHCLRLRDQGTPSGIVAILVYPMNALVNDQLDRLRLTLAGTGITFGRYTGETEDRFPEDVHFYNSPVSYTGKQRQTYKDGSATFGEEALPLPWEERFDKDTIRANPPRLLLTNYAQLEYLLLRDRDLELFRGAPLRFMVLDEVHTYTGALGSEVACLIRRLRDVTRKRADEVIMIGTSATVSDRPGEADQPIDAEAATRRFAHRLFGVPEDEIAVIREAYRELEPRNTYLPALPVDMPALLDDILIAAREVQLLTDIDPGDIPAGLVDLASHLCDQSPPNGPTSMDQLVDLLYTNACIVRLSHMFTEPRTWEEALTRWRRLDASRAAAPDADLLAEMLAYLTLGALAQVDGDPLLRPKLHLFVQGLQGLGIQFYPGEDPLVTFDDRDGAMPLLLCRSCGQHYARLIVGRQEASDESRYGYHFARVPSYFEQPDEGDDTRWVYLTDQFHTESEDDEDGGKSDWGDVYVCSRCFTIHERHEPHCLNPECHAEGTLITLRAWSRDGVFAEPKTCGACGGPNTRKTPLISYTRSAGVADVTILAQSMLTLMSEPSLRKLLIFADSRQEAAFQAGWMDERAKRYRLRHLAYQLVAEREEVPWGWSGYVDELIIRAQQQGILRRRDFGNVEQQTQIRWFLIEEFAFVTQRRSNLEQLGLIKVVYGDLRDQLEDSLFTEWAERFSVFPNDIVDCVQILLDTYRRRGMLSDSLLARWWSPTDREVYHSWINVPDFYRPKALVLEKRSRQQALTGLVAGNGRSAAQLIVQKAFDVGGQRRDEFLRAVWEWLVHHAFVVPVEMVQRRRGTVQAIPGLPAEVYQVNVERIGLRASETIYICTHCHRAQQVPLPSGLCPEYNCHGELRSAERDMDHFDVLQYTRHDFVSMNAREHSAQVPQDRRLEAERSFKSEAGVVNVIVATPTLEMGVDIGKLEMTMMRNVPPTPANYSQRAGRAGRRHRIAAVFTYAGGSHHDRYFFNDPPEMIAGSVRVPAFSMQNEPLIRKHVHSATLTILREIVQDSERAVLEETFPTYIRAYLAAQMTDRGRTRLRYADASPDFATLADLIAQYRPRIVERLVALFSADWPEEDRHAVEPQGIGRYLDGMPSRLQQHVRLLFNQLKAYRNELRRLREIEESGVELKEDERKLRERLEQARDSYMKTSMGNYTLSWLSSDGFFPGYALARESVQATCIQPLMNLSRPAAIALRELTPANWVYADGRVFGVQRLNFNKLKADNEAFTSDLLREDLVYESGRKRVYDPARAETEGGDGQGRPISSYQLTDVEMEHVQSIDDRRDIRRRVPFEIAGMLLEHHGGGHRGRVGHYRYLYLMQETVRLVNVGPVRLGPSGEQGFPLCPVCGETRSPQATQVELEHFRDSHRERCGVKDITVAALHVDIMSDVLRIGPFASVDEAVNAYEGVLAGARLVLDMNRNDLEGMVWIDEHDAAWAVLYDTLPGGTGFLSQLLVYWDVICDEGIKALHSCTCEKACYQCLQHFRNQQYHPSLDRHLSADLLAQLRGVALRQHAIPSQVIEPVDGEVVDKTESPAEEKFLDILRERNYPLPDVSQFRVDLGNANYTVADFAWPDARVLMFIDGTSMRLHGDPQRAQSDRQKRRQARMLGWYVIVITAQELDDEHAMGLHLDDIAGYLGFQT